MDRRACLTSTGNAPYNPTISSSVFANMVSFWPDVFSVWAYVPSVGASSTSIPDSATECGGVAAGATRWAPMSLRGRGGDPDDGRGVAYLWVLRGGGEANVAIEFVVVAQAVRRLYLSLTLAGSRINN